MCLLDKVDKETHGTDNKLKRVLGDRGNTALHATSGMGTLAIDNISAGHKWSLGSHSAANNRGGGRAAGGSARGRRADQRLAGSASGLGGLSGAGAVGARGRRGGSGAGLSSVDRGIDLGTSLEETRVVGLAILGDLEGIVVALLDVVTRGPGEGAILGLVGDGLHILQVAGVSFAESKSDRLDNRSANLNSTER